MPYKRIQLARTGFSIAFAAAAAAAMLSAAQSEQSFAPLGEFAHHQDIGSPKLAGSAAWNGVSQEYALKAGGVNLWGARDEFHYAWKRMAGDFILQARVELVGQGCRPAPQGGPAGTAHARRRLALRRRRDPRRRADLAPVPAREGRRHRAGRLRGEGRRLPAARAPGRPLHDVGRALRRAAHAQHARSRSPSATRSTSGLFLCSHNADVVEQAVFRDVRVIRPAKAGFTPYRDYIGSVLEVLDVATRPAPGPAARRPSPSRRRTGRRDGKALIYNTSGGGEGRGRLHRFDLATRQASVIDTGFAIRNNNDHVLSFDGRMLAISDQSQDERPLDDLHAARLGRDAEAHHAAHAVLPPRLVARREVRWSTPAAATTSSTSTRSPSDGSGQEIRLTDVKALDDGPEYSPDGRYIYFNSTRSGLMQLWRMKPDGSEPERVTNDEYNNWFPHLSPDGQRIAFISYGQDVAPADHPYYKQTLPAADAGRGRPGEGDRLRLRRAGHDQRPVVVARRPHARVRQQQRPELVTRRFASCPRAPG